MSILNLEGSVTLYRFADQDFRGPFNLGENSEASAAEASAMQAICGWMTSVSNEFQGDFVIGRDYCAFTKEQLDVALVRGVYGASRGVSGVMQKYLWTFEVPAPYVRIGKTQSIFSFPEQEG